MIVSAVIDVNQIEKNSREPPQKGDACLLVIFGASGDLTSRKLIPGLYNLACAGCMNPQFEVLGVGRTPMTSEEFRAKMREAVPQSSDTRGFNESQWKEFEQRLHYLAGDITDEQFYSRLKERLGDSNQSKSS